MPLLSRWTPVSILLALVAVERAPERHEFTEVHMGLPVRIVLYVADANAARDAASVAYARIAALDAVMSDYRTDSELSSLNARAGEWVTTSQPLFDVVHRALDVARLTEGAFDPSVGPLVALWREARRTKRLPSAAALAAARDAVGWQRIELDAGGRAIRLAAGMRLDLGGIAKGYVLQDALRTLAARGASRALIEAGGDIVAGAAPPGRDGWRIDARADGDLAQRAQRLTHAALATSGPTRQFVEIDGVRYSHVVDPRMGIGLTHDAVAHVIAADAAIADALATAATVLGAQALPKLQRRFPAALIQLSMQ